MLGSASGLAYMAFAPEAEQAMLLDLLARSGDPEDALARNRVQAERLITATRSRGFGLRQGGDIWPHTGAVALPIRTGRQVIGCINAIWMARVIDHTDGVRRCLDPLRETRDRIEAALAAPG